MKLPLQRFKRVVRDSVLVSLDMLVLNNQGEVLVGLRRNSPAKGCLFVPGGRIYKGETLRTALQRISKSETGVDLSKECGTLYGVYDHIYRENAWGQPGLSTQYVVIACLFQVHSFTPRPCDDQHEELRMMSVQELLSHPKVHAYTRHYFVADPTNLFLRLDNSAVRGRSTMRSGLIGGSGSADKTSAASIRTARAGSRGVTMVSKSAR
jgi:colanic acid biosynthesis protein WcaH